MSLAVQPIRISANYGYNPVNSCQNHRQIENGRQNTAVPSFTAVSDWPSWLRSTIMVAGILAVPAGIVAFILSR